MSPELTEQDIIDMKNGFKSMKEKVEGLDLSGLATKKEMELCIGDECGKLSTSLGEVKKAQGDLKGQVDHIDELVHKHQNTRFKAPPRDAHEAAKRKAAQEAKDDKHAHPDMAALADCPDCYPGMKAAVEPKLIEEGYRKGPYQVSTAAREKLRKRGVPTCTTCGVPWVPDEEGKVAEKCDNCGGGVDDKKE